MSTKERLPFFAQWEADDPEGYRRARKAVQQRYNRELGELRSSAIAIWKLERGCADCGDRWEAIAGAQPEALEFDHRPGETKVTRHVRRLGLSRMVEEMEKCDVVCAIDHAIRTRRRLMGEDA